MHTIYRYIDGQSIGKLLGTSEDYCHLLEQCQQPEGLIRLGVIPHEFCELDPDYQDCHEDTTVYID